VAAEEAKPAAANASHGDETVLIVEDQRAVRGLAKAILERHGYHSWKPPTARKRRPPLRGTVAGSICC